MSIGSILTFKRIFDSLVSFNMVFLTRITDLLLRIWLFKTFFISAILKISDWDKALYLSQYEYPLTWINHELAAYLGVAIEFFGALSILLGLATRFGATALCILSVIIQTQYRANDMQILWILFFAYYAINGARSLSLDNALKMGLKQSPLPFVATISKIFDHITTYVMPLHLLLLRVFLACVIALCLTTPMAMVNDVANMIGFNNLEPLFSQSSLPLLVIALLVLCGFLTRITALIVLVALFFTPQTVSLGWYLIVMLLVINGASKLSLDYVVAYPFLRKIDQLEKQYKQNLHHLKHVVIIGGGFGGVSLAQKLKYSPCRITLIDKNNYHLFQPLLYQVATSSLSPGDIAMPIRELFAKQDNIRVLMQEAVKIDHQHKQLVTNEGVIDFDHLVIASGAKHSYFGKDHWAKFALGLKTLDDATNIRRQILLSLERAENTNDAALKAALLRFVIVGGGPTGVELAGAIAELTQHDIQDEFSNVNLKDVKIYLVQSANKLLPPFDDRLSHFTKAALEKLGVTILTNHRVSHIDEKGVKIDDKEIVTENIFWAAGVEASPAAKWLDIQTSDRAGRLEVDEHLCVKGCQDIFAIGDVALSKSFNGQAMPGIAPAAKQSGTYVAKYIHYFLRHHKPYPQPFKYVHLGNLATIGRKLAVADFALIKMKGAIAWWFWGFIHVFFLAGMRNRVSVTIEWVWSYLTLKRGSRLITKNRDS